MAKGSYLSIYELAVLAYRAGFRGRDLLTAVAIALAESKGNATVPGDTKLANETWGPSIGLWQIRSLNRDRGTGRRRDATKLTDPFFNAQSAFSLYRDRKAKGQSGFEDWTTYKNGSWRQWEAAVADVLSRNAQGIVKDATRQDWKPTFSATPQLPKPVAGPPTPVPALLSANPPGVVNPPPPGTVNITNITVGGSGVGSTQVAGEVPPDPSDPAAVDAWIRSHYGAMAWALDHPELGDLLRRAATEGWTADRLQAELTGTNWWRTKDAAQRGFEVLRNRDPAQAERMLAARALEMRLQAERLGFTLSETRAREIAERSLTLGWNETDIRLALIAESRYGTVGPGDLKARADSFVAAAKQWMVPLSEASALEWARKVEAQEATEEGFLSYLRDLSKSLYPHLATYIDRGVSPGTLFDPYRQLAANILERPAESFDLLSDPRWRNAISFNDGGTIRPMTLNEWATYLRGQPEFETTRAAHEQAASLTTFLGGVFGVA